MIPIVLHIKNFLSYGPEQQTINFGPYHLICLSGKNGHGKSALLDAITWAIWGQARKVAGATKADEGLLRLGQTQMMVCLDFMLNNQQYRIRREFALTYGKPHTALDFGIVNPLNQHVASLTDKTIRATQEKIESTIGLDYESFTNSAFLRQGQSNEFSKKSPKERKEILATILGLNRYEHLRTMALETIRRTTEDKNKFIALHDHLLQELAQAPALATQEASLITTTDQITAQEQELMQRQDNITQRRKHLEQQYQGLNTLTAQATAMSQEERQALTTLRTLRQEWQQTHHQLLTLPSITDLEAQRHTVQQKLLQLQDMMQQHLALANQLLTRKQELHIVETGLRTQYALRLREHQEMSDRLALAVQHTDLSFKQEAQQLAEHATALERKLREHEQAQALIATVRAIKVAAAPFEQQFEKRKNYYQKYQAQGMWIKKEREHLQQKQHLTQDDQNPSCPLCEQNLSAARKRFLKAKFAKHEQFLAHRFNRLTGIVTRLKSLLVENHTTLTDLRTKIAEGETVERTATHVAQEMQQLRDKIQELTAQHEQTTIQAQRLQSDYQQAQHHVEQLQAGEQSIVMGDATYQTLHHDIEKIAKELALIAPDPALYEQLRNRLTAIEQRLQDVANIRTYQTAQEQRTQQIRDVIKHIRQIRLTAATTNKHILGYAHLDEEQATLDNDTTTLAHEYKTLTGKKEQLFQLKGTLEQQRAHLARREQELQDCNKKMSACTRIIDEYQTIAAALGKDGIQALLIEDAIPEIEQEANRLLAKLTDNQAHIFIESLRDLKKGGTKETLDIKISDAAGTRPYELFSGGEAFRIDYALRIAISKLLARRAGASLQTLIIDEGFGSQDEEGLAHVMDAMYKIQDDFAKVIIVSHLSSLKEQFPVHFVVEKGARGSVVQIVEQA